MPEANTAAAAVEPLLEVSDVVVEYNQGFRTPPVRALEAISLSVATGQSVAVVGESGSGKTTLGKAILGLLAVRSGRIRLSGQDVHLSRERRGNRVHSDGRIQAVFQDPYSSLSPRLAVGDSIAEPLRVAGQRDRRRVAERVRQVLDDVGLPATVHRRRPGELSGGQLQRVALARALVNRPKLIVCDEPTSALDVCVQAQVLNVMADLREEYGVGYLFISHNLHVVRCSSDWTVVLQHGRIVESGPTTEVCVNPTHSYTQALLNALPALADCHPAGAARPPIQNPRERSTDTQ